MLKKLLDRPIAVTMVLLVLMVLGVYSAISLPVSPIPELDVPRILVQVSAPDMGGREINHLIVDPLKRALMQMGHLQDIHAEAKDGMASVQLYFAYGTDMDYVYIDANEKIDRAMPGLPAIERPKVIKVSASDIPVFFINLSTTEAGTFENLSEFARKVIARRLEQIDEVAMVDMSGIVTTQILVCPDENKLSSLGLSIECFESLIRDSEVEFSPLSVRDGEYRYNVKFRSSTGNCSELAELKFNYGGRIIRLGDIASIKERPAPRNGFVRSDGREAVCFAVIKKSDARMTDLKKSIGLLIKRMKSDYPQIRFTVTRNQTELLDYSIRNLMMNIGLAILLVSIVLFLFMKDFKTPFLVMLVIPVSVVAALSVFRIFGVSVNIISLSGLILGIGMLVDNTIVLTDNISARWRIDGDLRRAVVSGTAEVVIPMFSSLLTTCAVFIPLVFINGIAGDMFRDQAFAMTSVLVISYLVTITAIPVYYYHLYRGNAHPRSSGTPGRLLRVYDSMVGWTIANRWVSWALPIVGGAIIVICVLQMPKSVLPPLTYDDTLMHVDWNEPISLEENGVRTKTIESTLDGYAIQITSMVGGQQFVLQHSGEQSISECNIYFKCENSERLSNAKEILGTIMETSWPHAVFSFENSGNIFEQIFPSDEPVLSVILTPSGSSELMVSKLREQLNSLKQLFPDAGIPDVMTKADVALVADPEMMALYGVTNASVVRALENSLNGNHLFDLSDGDRTVPVMMGVDHRELSAILDETWVSSKNGSRIRAAELMRLEYVQDLKFIQSGMDGICYRIDLDIPRRDIRSFISRVSSDVAEKGMFDVSYTGTFFSSRELLSRLLFILLLALLLLYLILASQFESLVQPIIILSEIVIDVAVCLCVSWICDISFNVMSLIGLVVICGIVINDSILKVDTINSLRRSGMRLDDSIHEAGHRRFNAIVMTTLTTVLSVAPMLGRGSMGTDLQFPMSVIIVIGMSIGTLVSLFYVPAVYSLIYRYESII